MKQIAILLFFVSIIPLGCTGDEDPATQKLILIQWIAIPGVIILSIFAIAFGGMTNLEKKRNIQSYILTIIFLGITILLFSDFANKTGNPYYGFKAFCVLATVFFFFHTPIGRNIFKIKK